LDSEKRYYLGDSEWLDDPRSFAGLSIVSTGVDIVENVVTPGFMFSYTTLFADLSMWS
jgi:hypothetical protein